jgi:hypothetical protein
MEVRREKMKVEADGVLKWEVRKQSSVKKLCLGVT